MVHHRFGDAILRDERPADLRERSSQALLPSSRLEDVDRLFDQAERIVDLADTQCRIGDVLDDPTEKVRVARAYGLPA